MKLVKKTNKQIQNIGTQWCKANDVLFRTMVKFMRTAYGSYTTAVRSHPYPNSLKHPK